MIYMLYLLNCLPYYVALYCLDFLYGHIIAIITYLLIKGDTVYTQNVCVYNMM